MLSGYQLKIADLYNIPIGDLKKLVPNFFGKEQCVLHYGNLQLYLRLNVKLKKHTSRIRIQSITMGKTIYRIQQRKKNKSRKNGEKDGKPLYKLRNNAVYGKTMENLRNRINERLVNNNKYYYLKRKSKPRYVLHKMIWLRYVKTKLH